MLYKCAVPCVKDPYEACRHNEKNDDKDNVIFLLNNVCY